jgi:hypothetical protein
MANPKLEFIVVVSLLFCWVIPTDTPTMIATAAADASPILIFFWTIVDDDI